MHGTCLMRTTRGRCSRGGCVRERKRHGVDKADHEAALKNLQREVELRGEVKAAELEERNKPKEPWWDWTVTKSRLEYLVSTGAISTGRLPNFERTYLSLFEALPDSVVEARDAMDTRGFPSSVCVARRDKPLA